jgi:hypothetical protein
LTNECDSISLFGLLHESKIFGKVYLNKLTKNNCLKKFFGVQTKVIL